MTCKDCRFFFVEGTTCHRYPPIVMRVEDNKIVYVHWPSVNPTDWCGEIQGWPELQARHIEKAMEECP